MRGSAPLYTPALWDACANSSVLFFIPPLFHWKSWWVDGVPLVCVFFYPVSTSNSKFCEMIKNSVPLVCRLNSLKHSVMHRKTNVYRTCSIMLHTRGSTCTKYNFIKQLQEKKKSWFPSWTEVRIDIAAAVGYFLVGWRGAKQHWELRNKQKVVGSRYGRCSYIMDDVGDASLNSLFGSWLMLLYTLRDRVIQHFYYCVCPRFVDYTPMHIILTVCWMPLRRTNPEGWTSSVL